MKKFLIGAIFGAIMMLGVSAFADDIKSSLVGEQVQTTFPVQINGIQITDAVVIKNQSFLPARLLSEIFNSQVSFTDGQVFIVNKDGAVNVEKLAEFAKNADAKQAKWEQDRQSNLDSVKAEEDAAAKIRAEGDAEAAKVKAELDAKAKDTAQQIQPGN